MVKREVKARTETVWEVVIDHPGYADVAGHITKVEGFSDEGVGMKRRCHGPKDESWEETCELFVPSRAFGFRIHTEAEDYRYPISALSGKWLVKPAGDGPEFSIEIMAKPKGNALARWVFTKVAKHQFKVVLIDLADAWAALMECEARVVSTIGLGGCHHSFPHPRFSKRRADKTVQSFGKACLERGPLLALKAERGWRLV